MPMSEHASANLRAKMKDQMEAAADAKRKQVTPEQLEKQKQLNELLSANVVFETASLGGPAKLPSDKAPPKPLVRHLVVKDLRRVARNMNITFPSNGLFTDASPIALFALFDGQSCADAQNPGPQAADWCCRNIHTKLLQNMSALLPHQTNEAAMIAMLQISFAELDEELTSDVIGINDGCGAALALLVGDRLFTAVIGKCDVVLCAPKPRTPAPKGAKASGAQPAAASAAQIAPAHLNQSCGFSARSMGEGQGRCHLESEKRYLQSRGGEVFQTDQGDSVRNPAGLVANVSRSLGDRAWKGVHNACLLRCEPAIVSTRMSYEHGNSAIILTSLPVTEGLRSEHLTDILVEFSQKPRAISGEVVAQARRRRAAEHPDEGSQNHYAAVTVFFCPPKEIPAELAALAPRSAKVAPAPPPNKKQKTGGAEMNSLRVRHILLRHVDCTNPFDPVKQKEVTRPVSEADAILRQALREILQEQASLPVPQDAKKAALVHLQPSPRCLALIKEFSECESAKKAGGVSGDLGWMPPEALRAAFGPKFVEAARSLDIGQWSDLVASDLGVHLMQRIA